jgi:hypothetical protein
LTLRFRRQKQVPRVSLEEAWRQWHIGSMTDGHTPSETIALVARTMDFYDAQAARSSYGGYANPSYLGVSERPRLLDRLLRRG